MLTTAISDVDILAVRNMALIYSPNDTTVMVQPSRDGEFEGVV